MGFPTFGAVELIANVLLSNTVGAVLGAALAASALAVSRVEAATE